MTIQPSAERNLPGGNFQRFFRFDNGFGASVVQGAYTYGGIEGLWELAVVRLTGDGDFDFDLTYDTPITSNVEGHLDEDQVQELLARIRNLPGENVVKVESTLGEQPAIEAAGGAR